MVQYVYHIVYQNKLVNRLFHRVFFNKYVKRLLFHHEQVVEKDFDLSYFIVAIFILNSGILC